MSLNAEEDSSNAAAFHLEFLILIQGEQTVISPELMNLSVSHHSLVSHFRSASIRLEKGFIYLTAVIYWFSRFVLSWKLSNTLDTRFCRDVLDEALLYGQPEIFNTDQGAQFTAHSFLDILEKREIQISMDSKGRALDNIFVERLWRSLKYEEVYLKAYETVKESKREISSWINFYNQRRRHQKLGKQTPNQVYFKSLKENKLKVS